MELNEQEKLGVLHQRELLVKKYWDELTNWVTRGDRFEADKAQIKYKKAWDLYLDAIYDIFPKMKGMFTKQE